MEATMQAHPKWWHSIALVLLVSCATLARSEYDITLDYTGKYVSGSGDGYAGGAWYYYPSLGRWVQWFYNQPYSPARKAYMDVWVFIENPESGRLFYADVTYSWSTPQWSALGHNRPPLPADVSASEGLYIENRSYSISTQEGVFMAAGGSIEPHITEYIEGYNPEWIGISVAGKNIHVYRWITHECVDGSSDGGGTDTDPPTEPVMGACCNRETGACFTSGSLGCLPPNVWLGAGTTCGSCKVESFIYDFGDAPASYKTLKADNGPQHTITPGIYLGAGVNSDPDGKPSPTASLDSSDDGVQWGALKPGYASPMYVTASILGVINAWVDFNGDGDFADPGEKVFTDEPVGAGTNSLSFRVLSTAKIGGTFARVRYSTGAGLSFDGPAQDGEVEDYAVSISQDGGGGEPPPQGSVTPVSSQLKYGSKWSQVPKETSTAQHVISGWYEFSSYQNGPAVADDWPNKGYSPVTGIRWWGCFDGWSEAYPPSDLPRTFQVAIWTSSAMNPTFPGTLVWEAQLSDVPWTFNGYLQDPGGTMTGRTVFEFSQLLPQDKWFYTNPAWGSKYWVSISSIHNGSSVAHPWGWLTRSPSLNSGAIAIERIGSAATQQAQWPASIGVNFVTGTSIVQQSGIPWDMAFELISTGIGGSGTVPNYNGDVNGDGRVDLADAQMIINLWLNGGHID